MSATYAVPASSHLGAELALRVDYVLRRHIAVFGKASHSLPALECGRGDWHSTDVALTAGVVAPPFSIALMALAGLVLGAVIPSRAASS
jgi:hypothetical protein